MCDDSNNGKMKFMAGAILGGLIGAGAVYLIGTEGGKKFRKDVEKKGRKFVGDVEDKIAELEEHGKELLRKGEDLKEQIAEQLEEKKEDLTVEAAKRLDTALESVEKAQEKGVSTTHQLRKRFFHNVPKR